LAQYSSIVLLSGAIPKLCTSHWAQYPSIAPQAIRRNIQASRCQPSGAIYKHLAASLWKRYTSIAPSSGALYKHCAVIRYDIQASRCHQAQYSSIALPLGTKVKHRTTIRYKSKALRCHQVQNPPHCAIIRHDIQASHHHQV
jgi:hypothetical protein